MGCCPQIINSNDDHRIIQEKSTSSIPLPQAATSRQHANFSLSMKAEADALKEKGNKSFKDGNFAEALKCYNACIVKYPLDPVYFTNQAMCLRKLNRWDQALESANNALKLDPNNQKGQLHKAICLAELSKTRVGSKVKKATVEQSQEILLALKGRNQFVTEVEGLLQKVSQLKQIYTDDREKQTQAEFKDYLLKKIPQNPLTEGLKPHYSKLKDLSEEIGRFIQKQEQLNQCPQYFQDPISYQLFRTPFLSPSGISYEKQLLLDHMKVHGARDPTTKQDFTHKQPVVNKQLMGLVETNKNVTKWRQIEKRPMNTQFIHF